mmetsp:Transcript_47769/g.53232  ORF Transcript_47769/g.53232 Transcript_47769/m.53232 type:complete len:89 (+) Transcript_47769:402-668(+)
MKNQMNRNSKQQQQQQQVATAWKMSLYAFGVGMAAGFTIGVRSYRCYRFFFSGIFLCHQIKVILTHMHIYMCIVSFVTILPLFVCLFD